MEFNEYLMEDALSVIIDYRGKTPQKSESGIPTLSAKSVKNNYINYAECYYISENEYKRFMVRGFPKKGDILLTTEAPMGMVARLDRDDIAIAQRLLTLRGKDGVLDNDYLLYLLQSPYGQGLLKAKETGTTVTGIKQSEFRRIVIKLPDITVQKRVASILNAIDGKISCNTKINDNLLEQIQALYKAWFVDYLPFGGVKPESWTQTGIYSLANIIYGAPFASKQFNTEGNGKPIIRIRDLKDQQFATYTTEVHPKGYLLQPGDIVVGMDGEFRPYIWGNDEAWLNQRVCVFENKRPNGKAFLYFTIKPLLFAIEQTQVATTVIHIGKKDYDAFEITLPDSSTLDSFDALTSPMITRIVSNSFENKRLAAMRDTLLPKLMSGEIDVSDIQL